MKKKPIEFTFILSLCKINILVDDLSYHQLCFIIHFFLSWGFEPRNICLNVFVDDVQIWIFGRAWYHDVYFSFFNNILGYLISFFPIFLVFVFSASIFSFQKDQWRITVLSVINLNWRIVNLFDVGVARLYRSDFFDQEIFGFLCKGSLILLYFSSTKRWLDFLHLSFLLPNQIAFFHEFCFLDGYMLVELNFLIIFIISLSPTWYLYLYCICAIIEQVSRFWLNRILMLLSYKTGFFVFKVRLSRIGFGVVAESFVFSTTRSSRSVLFSSLEPLNIFVKISASGFIDYLSYDFHFCLVIHTGFLINRFRFFKIRDVTSDKSRFGFSSIFGKYDWKENLQLHKLFNWIYKVYLDHKAQKTNWFRVTSGVYKYW